MTKPLSRIELLRQKLKEEQKQAQENNGKRNFSSTRNIFPFWLMKDGEQVKIRIFLDKNEDNDKIFHEDRLEHSLPINGKTEKIPCRKMYGETCPICDLSQAYYKNDDEENGKVYYRKKTSYIRILVLESPQFENSDEVWVGKTCNTQITKDLLTIIKTQISDPDLGAFDDLDEGTDFIISKTKDGKWSTYKVGTGFARRPSAVPQEYREGIELIDLSTLLPEDFGLEKVTNMLNAHLTGGDYTDSSDKPDSSKKEEKAATPVKKTPAQEPESDDGDDGDDDNDDAADEPVVVESAKATETPATDDSSVEPTDLLASLRKRREARVQARK